MPTFLRNWIIRLSKAAFRGMLIEALDTLLERAHADMLKIVATLPVAERKRAREMVARTDLRLRARAAEVIEAF